MLTVKYVRTDPPRLLGEPQLGLDIPGADTISKVGKGVYYVGLGTALIVASLFVWKIVDTVFGD